MKQNSHILTAGRIFGILLMSVMFCRCSHDFAEEPAHDGTKPTLVLQMNQGDKPNESIVSLYSSYLFHHDKLIRTNTSELDASGIQKLTISIPDGYAGERLKAMVVINDRVIVPDQVTLTEFIRQAITTVTPALFSANGIPMSGEVDFEVKPAVETKKIEMKRACSAVYVKLAAGSDGDLSDFAFNVRGVQQAGGFLFQDGAIPGETEDISVDNNTLTGKLLQPLCYFYPTDGDVVIDVIPDPEKYPGVEPLPVTLPRDKALLKNQKHSVNITPPTPVSSFKVTIVPWSEEELGDVDVSDAYKTDLQDLDVNTGNETLQLKKEGSDAYSLMLDNRTVSSLRFSLPQGATISPNPNTLLGGGYKQEEFMITSAAGKAGTFKLRYYPDKLYTLVVLGDTEYGFRGYGYDAALTDVNKIALVKEAGNRYFKDHPSLKIDPELLMVVGDISGDRDNDWSRFESVFANCYRVGIKCMNIYGNHDWDPEYWVFADGTPDYNDPGFTLTGLGQCRASKDRIKKAAAKSDIGITDFVTSQGETPSPYYFTYRGVRYYCGNSFWFLPSFRTTPSPIWGSATLYNSDDIISSLESVLSRDGADYPAVWMHHYPFRSDNRWWNDYLRGGSYLSPNAVDGRKNKMKQLIGRTKNPAAFAGHVHYSAVDTYTDPASGKAFTEYVTPYFRNNGGSGYFVLVSEKEGVLAVQEFNFNGNNF